MAMNPSFTIPSLWFYTTFIYFFLLTDICISSAFFSSSTPTTYSASYSDHCSFIVPESTPTFPTQKHFVPPFVTSYFTGGDRLLAKKQSNQNLSYYYVGKSLRFPVTPYYYETQTKGIYKVEAYLYIRSPYSYYGDARRKYTYGGSYYHSSRTYWSSSVRSLLNGFWSENSSKLCMVGSATWEYEEGKGLNLDVVLKLNYPVTIQPCILALSVGLSGVQVLLMI